jgi:hypothetical protein
MHINNILKGIRYRLIKQSLREKLVEELNKEENLENDYFDEPTNYLSVTKGSYSVPGFVSKIPPSTTVKIFSIL